MKVLTALRRITLSKLKHPTLPVSLYGNQFEYLPGHENNSRKLEAYYTNNNSSAPIYKRYRYSIKPGWLYYGPLSALNDLNKLDLLKDHDRDFLKQAVGDRTLTVSLEECRAVLKPYLQSNSQLFLSPQIPDLGKRLLQPDPTKIKAEVNALAAEHRARFNQLSKMGLLNNTDHQPRVLEIGYTSGGTSVIGFERCGCEAHAIDYFFDRTVVQTPRHEVIKSITDSTVQFHQGDITQATGFAPNSFDIVYSSSVIEHIGDLGAACIEISRLLKPGGLSIHSYDPYFHPAGGHSLGILDSPWAHVRLPIAEIPNYIRIQRPFEADIAIPWIENALHQHYTQSYVQKVMVDAGFELCLWHTTPVSKQVMSDLSSEIITDCFSTVPGLTLQDLITHRIYFVAQKTA